MSRRESWKGASPSSEADARLHLLQVTQDCIERHGFSKVTLSDVAEAAGVTRPTVYRYFGSAEELLNAAAVTASGGYLERMRERILRIDDPIERIVEVMAITISEIPDDPYLSELFRMRDPVSLHSLGQNAFVGRELRLYVGDHWQGEEGELDELAELSLRLLKSFLDDPGPERDGKALRAYLTRWLAPMLEPHLRP
ncbi:MAG: TetR/AcrR family transcriptional regulator [Myxococcota bacterium]